MATTRSPPQALFSSYALRLRTYKNSLLTPVIPSLTASNLGARVTKRGTTIINYAEDGYDDYDDDDDDTRRRPTGLRSLRREDSAAKIEASEKVGKDTAEPVEVQGVWRDWMGKNNVRKSDQQNHAQALLPLTLIPIRIDLDVPAFTPLPPVPAQGQHTADPNNALFKPQETTLPYRLRDAFLWNLHETLITTDQFAATLVQDLDLVSNRASLIPEISKQIRTQLEEYAGVALHPLFHSSAHHASVPETAKSQAPLEASTPAPNTPMGNGGASSTPHKTTTPATVQICNGQVTAAASPMPPDADDCSPDDTYRCIVNLNINLASHVYTDKFEWSLLHPPGTAEMFAKQTCADLGLHGEWVPAMTHAIYEAVLRLKKEACESGGLVAGWTLGAGGAGAEFPNDATRPEGAGWRYSPEGLADDWEPKVETLSKEEIEKREGDRERQIRRLRRETARFSSVAGMTVANGVPMSFGFGGLIEQDNEERMGRGERSKKKRRFRSLSPQGRSGTPGGGGRGTPIGGGGGTVTGGYGGGGTLKDEERHAWRCDHCKVWGTSVWAARDGPNGPRTLCNNCGFVYERRGGVDNLPRWCKNLHLMDPRPL